MKKETRKRDVINQIKLWKKELKNQKSKYSDYFIYRQIEEYQKELKEINLKGEK